MTKVNRVQINTDPMLITMRKGDVIGSFQPMVLLGQGNLILSCVIMIAYNANINDGPHTFPSVQQSSIIDGHQTKLVYCCK
jgi:hypothetical protein